MPIAPADTEQVIKQADEANQKKNHLPGFYEPRKRTATAVPSGTVSFAATEFVDTLPGLPGISENLLHRENSVNPDTITFSPEVVAGIKGGGRGLVDKIIRLKNEPVVPGSEQTKWEKIVEEERRVHTTGGHASRVNAYLDKLVDMVAPKDPATGKYQLNEEKFNDAYTHSEVWEATIGALEEYAERELASLGISLQAIPKAEKSKVEDFEDMVILPIDKGWARQKWEDVKELMGSSLKSAGRSGTGPFSKVWQVVAIDAAAAIASGAVIGGGILYTNPVAIGVGAVAGLSTIAANGIKHLTRAGFGLALKKDANALQRAQQESSYSLYMHNIDPNSVTQDRAAEIVTEAAQIAGLRALYLNDLGVPGNKINALSSQEPEHIGVHYLDSVNQLTDEYSGNRKYGTTEWFENRRHAINDITLYKLRNAENRNLPHQDPNKIDVLEAKLTAIKDGARAKKAKDQLQFLTKDQDTLTQEQQHFTTYEETLRKIARKREELEQRYKKITILDNTGTVVNSAASVDEAIALLQEAINKPGDFIITGITNEQGSIIGKLPFATDEEMIARTEHATEIANIRSTPPRTATELQAQQFAFQANDTRLKERLDELDKRRNLLQDNIATLENMRKEIRDVADETTTREQINAVTGLNENIEDDYRTIYDLVGRHIPAATWDTMLTVESFDDALRIANSLYGVTGTGGWSEDENEYDFRRRQLLHARIYKKREHALEARFTSGRGGRAASAERNAYRLLHVTIPPLITPVFTDYQISTLSEEEIQEIFNARGLSPSPGNTSITLNEIAAARRFTNESIETTLTLYNNELRAINNNLQRAQQEITLSGESPAAKKLETIVDLVKNNFVGEEASGRILDEMFLRQKEMEDATVVQADEVEYTDSEVGLPKNILAFLNAICDYKKGDKREEEFKRILKDLGGEAGLLDRLNKAFNFHPALADLSVLAIVLSTDIKVGNIGDIDIRQAAENLRDILVAEGMAI